MSQWFFRNQLRNSNSSKQQQNKTVVIFEIYIYLHALLDFLKEIEYIGNMVVTSKENRERWLSGVQRGKGRTKKMYSIQDFKTKMKGLPQDLVGLPGESACILFYIWNTESDKGCLLSLTKTRLQFYLPEVEICHFCFHYLSFSPHFTLCLSYSNITVLKIAILKFFIHRIM